jgi:RNA polymerase sigma-70 factor (ECF subfamily)
MIRRKNTPDVAAQKHAFPKDFDIEKFATGDEKAFADFFNHHHQSLSGFARFQYFKDWPTGKEEAEDLVTETFIKIYQRRQTFKSAMNLKAFMYITLANTCRNKITETNIRFKGARKTLELLDQEIKDDSDIQAEMDAIKAKRYTQLHQSVSTLSKQCQKVIQLNFFEGKDRNQIGNEMGIHSSTVRSHMALGLRALRKKITRDPYKEPTPRKTPRAGKAIREQQRQFSLMQVDISPKKPTSNHKPCDPCLVSYRENMQHIYELVKLWPAPYQYLAAIGNPNNDSILPFTRQLVSKVA